MRRHFDLATLAIILITLILFAVAIFEKGLTHDLLLEAGVFLVSIKLVLSAYKSSVATHAVLERLTGLESDLRRIEGLIVRQYASREEQED